MIARADEWLKITGTDWHALVRADMVQHGEDPRDWDASTAAEQRVAASTPPPVATIADVADHVEHVREVAGIEHVGLGGDFDGTEALPEGLGDVSTYPALLDALRERGWSDTDLAALTHRNVLRVMRDAGL